MCFILLTLLCFGRLYLTLLLILSFSIRVPLISNWFHFSEPIVLLSLYFFRFSNFRLWPWISALTCFSLCFVLVLEDFLYNFCLPVFLGQVPMCLIFYVFTSSQRLLMRIYPYEKKIIIFISIIIYLLGMKSHCICG